MSPRNFSKLILLFAFLNFCYSHPFNKYCDLKCGKQKNLVCKRIPCALSKDCTAPSVAAKFDDEDARGVANIHNEFRQIIATGQDTRGGTGNASNMYYLTYSRELAFSAQCWANSCNTEVHCLKTFNFDNDIGFNIYLDRTVSKPENIDYTMRTAILHWFNEIDNCDYMQIDNFDLLYGTTALGFIQLIWADTRYVGCGTTFFDGKQLTVCLYSPKGRVPGMQVYKRGDPCSRCEIEDYCNPSFNGLCGMGGYSIDFNVPFKMMNKFNVSRGDNLKTCLTFYLATLLFIKYY